MFSCSTYYEVSRKVDAMKEYPGGASKTVFVLFVIFWWAMSILLREPERYEMKDRYDN